MTETNENRGKCGEEVIGRVIRYRYRVLSRLSSGSFGIIYIGQDLANDSKVAIKMINKVKNERASLKNEIRIYKRYLERGPKPEGIPVLHWYGLDQDFGEVMVLDLMGPDLEKLFRLCGRTFSLKTLLMIGIQMLERLQELHSRCVIHRDLKPENFVMGTGSQSKTIFLIDFGLSKPYIDRQTGHHIEFKMNSGITGTARYCSINTNRGCEQSRRDDLESVAYLLAYFHFGKLPWQGLRVPNGRKHIEILDVKENTSSDQLFNGMDAVFVQYLHYCRDLIFKETPDYMIWINKFRELFDENQFRWDYRYDWDLIDESQTLTGDRVMDRGVERQ